MKIITTLGIVIIAVATVTIATHDIYSTANANIKEAHIFKAEELEIEAEVLNVEVLEHQGKASEILAEAKRIMVAYLSADARKNESTDQRTRDFVRQRAGFEIQILKLKAIELEAEGNQTEAAEHEKEAERIRVEHFGDDMAEELEAEASIHLTEASRMGTEAKRLHARAEVHRRKAN